MRKCITVTLLVISIFLVTTPAAVAYPGNGESSQALTSYSYPIQTYVASPRILLTTSASLTVESSGGLQVYVRFTFASEPEMLFYKATLQYLVNGTWQDYTSYVDLVLASPVVISEKVAPPKGYTYRVKVTGASASFPNLEFYSRDVVY